MQNSNHLAPRVLWELVVPLAIAVGFPWFVLATNERIPFVNDFHCDTWAYFGFFYLVDHQSVMDPGARLLSRIPAIWIGRTVTDLVPGVWADYLNFAILYSGANVALYFAVLRFFGGLPALIATAFVAFNTLVIGDLAVTLTGPSLFYSALAILFAAESHRESRIGRSIALVLLGAALACLLHGHAYAIECAIAIPLYALRPQTYTLPGLLRQLVEIAIMALLGVVLATLLIGSVDWLFYGGKFLFFAPQVESVRIINFSGYQIPEWFFKACRGAVALLAIAVPLLAMMGRLRDREADRTSRQIWLVNIVTLAIGVITLIDDRFGGFFLQYDYYYFLLLPHIGISLASLFARGALSRRTLGLLVAAYVAVIAASTLPSLQAIARVVASPDDWFFSFGLAAAMVAALAVAVFTKGRRISAVALALALILTACWGFSVRPQRMGRQVWDDDVRGLQLYSSGAYARVRAALDFLSSYHFASRPVFWVSIDDHLEETIAVPRSFGTCIVEMRLPKLEMSDGIFERDFKAGNEIVLVQRDAGLVEAANASLKPHGLVVREHERKMISDRGVSYYVVVGNLERL